MAAGAKKDVRLSWVVVSHESARDLRKFLPSLCAGLEVLERRGFGVELIVVDNASTDDSEAVARSLAPNAMVIRMEANVGYGAAINRAALLARGAWLAVGNADLFVPDGGLDRLPAALAGVAPDVALVGPAIYNLSGRLCPSAGNFPSLATLITGLVRPSDRRKYRAVHRHRPGVVDWVTGACQFVRRDVFAAMEGFDPEFFLYYEDVDLALRLAQHGHKTIYEPSLSVVHVRPHHGRAPHSCTETHVRTGRLAYFKKHRPRWEQALLALLMGLEPFVRPRVRRANVRGPIVLPQPPLQPAPDVQAAQAPRARVSARRGLG